jgi:hypothetical protein
VSVGADVFTLHGDGYTYLSIADTDTGWTEAINPNADEVKAYMNGWQAAFSSSNRYVIFKSLVDGSYCPINLNADVATTSNTTTVTLSSNPGFVVGDSIVVSNTGVAAAITGVNGNTLTFAGSMNVTAGTSKIIKFTTAATDYCKANVAPNYAGYQLHYKLATPEPITALNCPISGDLWSLVKGDNYITMDSGIVLGEVANPVLNAGYYQLNNTQFAGSELKNKVDDILYTYRNGISDANWTQTSDGYAIGKEREYCPQAKYDTNATYTVDYKILATIAPQIVSSITLAYPQSVYDSIESIGKAVEGKQDRNNILDMLIDLAQYETLKFEYQGKGVDRTGIGVTFVMTTALTPKITKPIITAKLTTAMFLVGSNSNNLTMSDMQIRRITVLGQNNNQLAVEVAYIGADASVKGYLSSSGVGYFIVDIIADCRGRI